MPSTGVQLRGSTWSCADAHQLGTTFNGLDRRGMWYAGDRDDDGFAAGYFIRTSGRRGVYVGAYGACDGPTSARDALLPWHGKPYSVD